MSAIVGLYTFNQQPVMTADLVRMGDRLTAYGPDRAGSWQQGEVGLAQRQMIITPEDQYERQPLVSRDGRLVLVSDARLDNRPELIDALQMLPAEARQLPDSALILAAYERWGEDAPQQLMGDYAFALWDDRQQHLLLVRSPLGNRPLYYYQEQHRFAFATMPGGLFALPWVPRTLALENWLDPDPNRTIYVGLKKLASGHCLQVSRQGVKERAFWQLDLERRLHFRRDEEYVEAFDELFTRAVQIRLRSLYPVGVAMSGGLDSSSVAVTAARLLAKQGQSLTAYTQVPRTGFDGPLPPGKYADETPFVQAIAAMTPNLRLQLVHTEGRDLFADLAQAFATLYGPFQNVSNRVWIEAIQAQAQAQGVRVLLSGTGGNLSASWAGVSPLPDLLRQGAWRQAWAAARAQVRTPIKAGQALLTQGVLPLLPRHLQTAIHHLRQRDLGALMRTQPLATALHPQLVQATHRQYWVTRQRPMAGAERHLRYTTLLRIVSADQDAAYGAHVGLSRRDPTSDQRLVEFCFAVPETQWRRGGETRSLIRRAMAGRLPPAVLHNPKRGIQAADWAEQLWAQRASIQADLARIAQNRTAQQVLDLPRIRQLADRLHQPGWSGANHFADYQWVLLSGLMFGHFILWFEANVLQTPSAEAIC
jgi:asparagine synthase (glutamine-hydrolysing)